jgi:hypothetical protein
LCGERKARRTCPAVGKQICAVCCGTKRLTQIQCPADCPYLASARTHPPAAVVRRRERDVELFLDGVRDLSETQSKLYLMVTSFFLSYEPAALHPLIDDDVIEAAAAMAGTYETAARGLIFEHRPASLPAERLVAALKPALAELAGTGGSAFERTAAIVLRRIEASARTSREHDPENRRAFLDLLARMLRSPSDGPPPPPAPSDDAPRLIVP